MEQYFKPEEREEKIEALMRRFISEEGLKINEGNNGIIVYFKYNEIPAQLRDIFFEKSTLDTDEFAVKVIKIYSEHVAEVEFGMQQRARRILEKDGLEDDPYYAHVPRAHSQKTITLSPESRQALAARVGHEVSEKMSFLVMDFVQGDDLMTHLLKELIVRDKNSLHNAGLSSVDHMSFNEMFSECGRLCGYSVPGGKSGNPDERLFEEKKVMTQNATKLIKRLKVLGYKPHPSIISQIKNTMDLFHQNGFYFRDGHQRNFMLSSRDGEGPQVSVIDFGSSIDVGRRLSGADAEHVYDDYASGKRCVDDEYIIRFLESFDKEDERDDLQKKLEAVKKGRAWKAMYPQLEFEVSAGGDKMRALEGIFRMLQYDRPGDIELFLFMGEELLRKGLLEDAVLKEFVTTKKERVPYSCRVVMERMGY